MRTILLFAAGLMIPAQASAQDCEPALLSGDQTITINGVDIAARSVAREMVQLRVGNEAGPPGRGATGANDPETLSSDGPPCPGTLRISKIIAGSDPDFPDYTLSGPGSRDIEILPDASSGGSTDSDIRIANFPPGPQGRALPLRIRVPTEWGLRAGTYTERLRLSVFDENGIERDTATLTITITIPRALSITLVGDISVSGTGPARVDLGTLSKTEQTRSSPFGARILSTSAYRVSFDSANMGQLLNDNGADRIAYELYFDGQRVELAGANSFPYLEPTPSVGSTYPLRVIVPPVVAAAGRYSDRVTVTVTAI